MHHCDPLWTHGFGTVTYAQCPASHKNDHIMAFRADLNIPQFYRRERLCGTTRTTAASGDNTHLTNTLRGTWQRNNRNITLHNRLIPWRCHFVLLWKVHPELAHLKHPTASCELSRVEFFMDDATTSSHPLHITRPDHITIPPM